MAFAGHARSMDLSHTPSGATYIGNVHPDRHHHIASDHLPLRKVDNTVPNRAKGYFTQPEFNQEKHIRNQNEDGPSRRLSFRDALNMGTDDMGNLPTKSLWIGNTPPGLTENDMRMAFEKYGPISSVRATPSKHCGFVNFERAESAIKAWKDCHEQDCFGAGVNIYVRYERPPSWLKDNNASLKRKRSYTNASASNQNEPGRRVIPTGPKVRNLYNGSPNGPTSQQVSISPPALRRHDTYRPYELPDEDRTLRTTDQSYRHNDTHRRSSYHDDNDDDALPKQRSIVQVGNEQLEKERNSSQRSFVGNNQPTSSRLAKSRSPSVDSSHIPNKENAGVSLGMGIKGLATSRRDIRGIAKELSDDARSGLPIKGTATQARTTLTEDISAQVSGTTTGSRNCLPSEESVQPTNVTGKRPTPLEETHDGLMDALDRNDRSGSNIGTCSAGTTSSDGTSSTHAGNSTDKAAYVVLPSSKDQTKAVSASSVANDKRGFAYLSHLFETKEKEDMVAEKARTISPFGRLRASSRETTSVQSAKTDPTPLHKSLPSTVDICDKCKKEGGSFLKLSTCSAPSCSTRFHLVCGNHTSVNPSTDTQYVRHLLCDDCFKDNDKDPRLLSLTKDMTGGSVESTVIGTSSTGSKVMVSSTDDSGMEKEIRATHSSAALRPDASKAHRSDGATSKRQVTHQQTSKYDAEFTESPPQNSVDLGARILNRAQVASPTKAEENIRRPNSPPTGPRSTRSNELGYEAFEIADRYKQGVTCPWWKRGNKCVRPDENCIFAHCFTGIETPNGRSVAKDWTCFDYRTSGCRYSENDCLYSHRDTGLHVGSDGKASKKHLECYWWRCNGRCTFSDSNCACAHYYTGLVAEEPMPRDTVRRGYSQSSTTLHENVNNFSALHRRSPSYSPPPILPTADRSSGFMTKFPSQFLSQEILESPVARVDHVLQRYEATSTSDTGVDPRLKRNNDSKSQPDQAKKSSAISNAPLQSSEGLNFDGGIDQKDTDHTIVQQSKQSTMNPCKNCSRLVFKAEICTDCLKTSQRQDSGDVVKADEITEQQIVDELDSGLIPQPVVFAVPAPRVLKRPRTGSSSNLFASKRMRPDMTTARSLSGYSSTQSGTPKGSQPPTLEQLNQTNSEKRATAAVWIQDSNDQDDPAVETPTEKQSAVISRRTMSRAPSFSPFTTLLETPGDRSRLSRIRPDDTSRTKILATAQSEKRDKIETLHVYDEPIPARSRSESLESDRDSDTPLAELRGRDDKSFWSTSTSFPSPKKTRSIPPASYVELATNGPIVPSGLATRCQTCIKYHRKCVHDFSGNIDNGKCYKWWQDRERQNIQHKAHYSDAERADIMRRAHEFEAAQRREVAACDTLNTSTIEVKGPDRSSEATDDESVRSSSSDEIQIPHSRKRSSLSKFALQDTKSICSEPSAPNAPAVQLSQMPACSGPINQSSVLDLYTIAKNLPGKTSPRVLEIFKLADIMSRLEAKGAVFDDSDSDDELDCDQAESDGRIDPLLRHKQRNTPLATQVLTLPSITKGQGLKNPLLISRRQMSRNFQVFGKAHKEVDRKIHQQTVLASVQRRDPDDILAPAKEFEENLTFQEFLGLQKGNEIEACLGKVSLPRGKCVMGLAFREKEKDPGVGVWGRERRGTRKEKPVFVVGL